MVYLFLQDVEIQSQAASLIPEMVNVLNKVPREMLLIFKTNDCLRGIDSSLKTRFRSNAFVGMTRSCTAVVYDQKIQSAKSSFQYFRLYIERALAMIAIEVGSFMMKFYALVS